MKHPYEQKGTPLTALYPCVHSGSTLRAQCCSPIIPDYARSVELIIISATSLEICNSYAELGGVPLMQC